MKNKETKFRFEQSGNVHKLYIYDDVTAYGNFNWETWRYDESETSCKYFRDKLAEIPDTGEIELHVNSAGGSVMEGIAIYNLLKQHPAHKVCYVDGFAYSIASVICLACDKIIMGLGTSILIHNMAMSVYGNASVLRKCADDLDTLMEGNRKIYMQRAKNLTEEQLEEMMNKETFLTAEQCLEYGFCDEIGSYSAETETLKQSAAEEIRRLRQQIEGMKSIREEMKMYAAGKISPAQNPMEPEEKTPKNTGEKPGTEKALKMMSAFLNAFMKEEKRA